MKKIITTFLISFLSLPVYSADQVEQVFDNVQHIQQNFFQSSLVPFDAEVKEHSKEEDDRLSDDEYFSPKDKYTDHMPLFKKTRLNILKAIKWHNKKVEERDLKREQERLKAEEEKEKKAFEGLDIKYVEYKGSSEVEVSDKKQKSVSKENKNEDNNSEVTELVGGVREHVTEKEMQLDCETVLMNDETGDVEAIGNPILTIPSQNITLIADKITYNKKSNIIKAIGHVILTKDGAPVTGDYMQVNMNEENIFMDNVISETPNVKIVAKNAISDNGILTLNDGKMYSETSNIVHLTSTMIGPDFANMIINDEDRSSIFMRGNDNKEAPKLRFSASHIKVNAGKEHDIYELKDTEVYFKDKYLFTWPSFTAYTNKKREYFEANYPEFGSQQQIGTYLGPGLVIPGPHGSTFKLIPMANYRNKLGFGGAVKFKSAFNDTQIMYGSASDIWVVRGKHILDENLYLQYGSNAYLEDWFMGSRLSKYNAELIYHKPKTIKDFLYKDADMTFTQRGAVGYAQDGEWNMRTENLKSSGIGTMRFKYMAEANQTLFKRVNKEERKAFDFGIVMQGSAAVYGTGDTQFIGRIGPKINTQYKNWMQSIAYYHSAISDHTPMPVYDMYRYGHSTLHITEAFRLCKYLSVGWSGYVSLAKDSPNGELFQENAFIFSVGPDDFKLNLGYDIMRQTTYFSVDIALDTKNTTVEFDKMDIKNPENLGKSNQKADDAAFKTTASADTKKQKLQYAEVIDIEDPDKESI